MWVFKVSSSIFKTHFSEWQRLFSHFYILLVLMKNDKLLVPNMFSVPIFKHIFSNLPLDYILGKVVIQLILEIAFTVGCKLYKIELLTKIKKNISQRMKKERRRKTDKEAGIW